jgi:hypothetical protein
VSSSRGLHVIGSTWALASLSDSILVLLPLCLNLNISLSMYFFCNSRIHVITLDSSLVSVVLCVNALVLAPHMAPG